MKRLVNVILAVLFCLICSAALADFTLPQQTKVIEAEAFMGDTSIGEVYLPDGLLRIGDYAFANSSVTRIHLPAGLAEIGEHAFDGCENLTVYAPAGSLGVEFAGQHGIPCITGLAIGQTAEAIISEEGGTALFSFVPDADAFVKCRFAGSNAEGDILDADMNSLYIAGSSDESGETDYFFVTAGSQYYIRAYFYEDIGTITVSLSTASIASLNPGDTAQAVIAERGDSAWFTFTAASDGFIRYRSIGATSVVGDIRDSEMYYLVDDYDMYGTEDFDIYYPVEAGAQYYLSVGLLGTNTGTIDVALDTVDASDVPYAWSANDGVLTLYGNGDMPDYQGEYWGDDNFWCQRPWYDTDYHTVVVSDGLTSLGNYVFSDFGNLTDATIPASVVRIGNNAFMSCASLESITIPEGVNSIDYYAFENCVSLTSITIPVSMTSIGYGAFSGCDNLTDVYYAGSEDEWNQIEIDSENDALINAVHFGQE